MIYIYIYCFLGYSNYKFFRVFQVFMYIVSSWLSAMGPGSFVPRRPSDEGEAPLRAQEQWPLPGAWWDSRGLLCWRRKTGGSRDGLVRGRGQIWLRQKVVQESESLLALCFSGSIKSDPDRCDKHYTDNMFIYLLLIFDIYIYICMQKCPLDSHLTLDSPFRQPRESLSPGSPSWKRSWLARNKRYQENGWPKTACARAGCTVHRQSSP